MAVSRQVVTEPWSFHEENNDFFFSLNGVSQTNFGEIKRFCEDSFFLVKIICKEKFLLCDVRHFTFEGTLFSEDDCTCAGAFMERLSSIINADFSDEEEEGDEEQQEESEEQEENNGKKKEENKKKRKKNRRKAGEISGRQMGVKKFDAEENVKGERPPLVPFIQTVEGMRNVLLEFSKGEEDIFTKDQASAMRIYFTRKLNLSSKDGNNSTITNLTKVALLPRNLYLLAMRIAERYEKGELPPPPGSKQRLRRSLSSSSFSFLKHLDPQKPEDQPVINELLTQWEETKIRPQQGSTRAPKKKTTPEVGKMKAAIKELEGVKLALKEKEKESASLKMERNTLEKALKEKEKEIVLLKKEVHTLKKNFKAQSQMVVFLKEKGVDLEEELRQAKLHREKELIQVNKANAKSHRDKEQTQANADEPTMLEAEEPLKASKAHAAHAAELRELRKIQEQLNAEPLSTAPNAAERKNKMKKQEQTQANADEPTMLETEEIAALEENKKRPRMPKRPKGKIAELEKKQMKAKRPKRPKGKAPEAEEEESAPEAEEEHLKQYKGYAYVSREEVKKTNIFQETTVLTRLRERYH